MLQYMKVTTCQLYALTTPVDTMASFIFGVSFEGVHIRSVSQTAQQLQHANHLQK